MADGLLSGLTNWIDQRKQAAKASIGLLADNPQEWLTQTTARYLPTRDEELQYQAVKQAGGDITQTPYYQKIFDLAQFQGSIKPTGLLTPNQQAMAEIRKIQSERTPTDLSWVNNPITPNPPNPNMMTVYRAGAEEGMTAKSGGPTFYAMEKSGAKPFEKSGVEAKEYGISPQKVIDASRGEGIKIYKDFLKETNHPAGYGQTHRPYWTAEPDFRDWLRSKKIPFDAIMFDEPTGVPSIAVYKK